jgi:hypothetical protein
MPATRIASAHVSPRVVIASLVCVIAAAGCGGARDTTTGSTTLPRSSVAKAPSAPSQVVRTNAAEQPSAPARKISAKRTTTSSSRKSSVRGGSSVRTPARRPAAAREHGHTKAVGAPPAKSRTRTKPVPTRPHRPTGTFTTAQAHARVQLSCNSYRASSTRDRGGNAVATQTLASALITLPMTVPADLQPVRGQLSTQLHRLTELTTHGSSSSAERQAAAMRPSIDKFASAMGVSPCTA